MRRTCIFCNCQVSKGMGTGIKFWSDRYNIIVVTKLANAILLWQCWKVSRQCPIFNYYCAVSIWQIVNKMVISCFIHKTKPSCTIPQWTHCTSKNIYSLEVFSVSKHQAQPCHYTIGLDSHRMTYLLGM